MLHAKPVDILAKAKSFTAELKEARQSVERMKEKILHSDVERFLYASKNIGGIKVITTTRTDLEAGDLRKLGDFLREQEMDAEVVEEAEIQIKYKGYIEREKFIADKLHRLENIRIPADFDFHSMNALTIEARQKLTRIRPATIGQASRIPGVSPADVNVLLVKFGR